MADFNMKFTQGHLTETMAYFIDLEESVNMFNTENWNYRWDAYCCMKCASLSVVSNSLWPHGL